MSEKDLPLDQPKAPAVGGDEGPVPTPGDPEQLAFIGRLLQIVDRELGSGEPRDNAAWAELEKAAALHPGGMELVAKLGGYLGRCCEEIEALSQKGDVSGVRASMMRAIRETVARKQGVQ
jgi:hypothetical protein